MAIGTSALRFIEVVSTGEKHFFIRILGVPIVLVMIAVQVKILVDLHALNLDILLLRRLLPVLGCLERLSRKLCVLVFLLDDVLQLIVEHV